MSLTLLLLALFCACALLAALVVPPLAPSAAVSAPALVVLISHLLARMATGTEHAPLVFATMLRHPVRAAQALINATIRQLPLPPWLGDWLSTLGNRLAELHRTARQTNEEVFALGALLRELGDLVERLTHTFGEFAGRAARISELATHVPAAMAELAETSRTDSATLDAVSQHVAQTDLRLAHLRNEIMELAIRGTPNLVRRRWETPPRA